MHVNLALLAGFVLPYSSVAGDIERTWLSGLMVRTAHDLLLGPVGLDLLSFETAGDTLRTLTERTLALVLLMDAADADLALLGQTA